MNQTTASVTPSLGNSSGVGLGDCMAGTVISGTTGIDGPMKLTWNIPTLTPGKTATTTFVSYAT